MVRPFLRGSVPCHLMLERFQAGALDPARCTARCICPVAAMAEQLTVPHPWGLWGSFHTLYLRVIRDRTLSLASDDQTG